jgi:hypothetical protein
MPAEFREPNKGRGPKTKRMPHSDRGDAGMGTLFRHGPAEETLPKPGVATGHRTDISVCSLGQFRQGPAGVDHLVEIVIVVPTHPRSSGFRNGWDASQPCASPSVWDMPRLCDLVLSCKDDPTTITRGRPEGKE